MSWFWNGKLYTRSNKTFNIAEYQKELGKPCLKIHLYLCLASPGLYSGTSLFRHSQRFLIIHDNYVVLNPDEKPRHGLGDDTQTNHKIKYSQEKKTFGITIDNKLNFTLHAKELTKKANQKLRPLNRVKHCMDSDKLKYFFYLLVNHSFVTIL